MILRSTSERSDAELALGYRAALRRAASAAREAALLSEMIETRGASTIASDETAEVEEHLMHAGRLSLEAVDGSLSAA